MRLFFLGGMAINLGLWKKGKNKYYTSTTFFYKSLVAMVKVCFISSVLVLTGYLWHSSPNPQKSPLP